MPEIGNNNHLTLRLVALGVSVCVALAAGTPYLYGVYGPQLIKRCGFTTSDSATVSLFTNIGCGLAGIPGGLMIDYFGPQVSIVIGSISIFSGYYGAYRIYEAASNNLGLLCCFMAFMGFGSTVCFFSTLKATQSNFPNHRGSAGALPVSAYGLSATIFSIIAATFFSGNSGGFIGFLSFFCGAVTFVGSWFVHVYLDHGDEEDEVVVPRDSEEAIDTSSENGESVGLLSRQNSSSTLNNQSASVAPVPPVASKTSTSLRGSFSFWGIGTRTPRSSVSSVSSANVPLIASLREQNQNSMRAPTISKQTSLSSLSNNGTIVQKRKPKTSGEVVLSLIKDKVFLLHYLIVSFISGTGQMYIYSVGFIVIAQFHYGESSDAPLLFGRIPIPADSKAAALQALQVSIISLSSFSGRLLAGLVSDFIYKTYHIQRLWIVLVTLVTLGIGQYLVMTTQSASLISLTSIIIGGSYGLVFGTYPAVIADKFGTRTFSTTWGLICTGPLITLFCLNKYFGMIYDRNTDPETGICYKGNECYRGAFELSFGLCFVLFALTLLAIYIQRKK
ncbi:hypothetical protein CAAN3_06S07316 [[Candida] anglica]